MDEGTTYERIAAHLREQILSGAYRPGANLPSTGDLQRIYGVARGTVDRAWAILRQEELIVSVPDYGQVVREPRSKDPLNLPAGSRVDVRAPRGDEWDDHEIDRAEPCALIVVTLPTGEVRRYPADRWYVVIDRSDDVTEGQ